ncbi:MAG TPA: hypothetical protein VII71_03860 [Verrucomicrobiae bacterium]
MIPNAMPDFSADEQPLRGELLSIDLLRQFARTLAQDHRVENGRGPNILLPRLASNEKILRDYNERTLEVKKNGASHRRRNGCWIIFI